MSKRITKNHAFMKKVNKLYDLMIELGIEIHVNGMGGLNIIDRENNELYYLKDNDTSQMESCFPTFAEFKLTFDK